MPEERTITVYDLVQGEYSRTITSRMVEFVCRRCGKARRREQFPGRTPLYCLVCRAIVAAERNAARQQRYRAKRAGRID